MDFQYKLRDPHGRIIEASTEGASENQVMKRLKARGLRPLVVIPTRHSKTHRRAEKNLDLEWEAVKLETRWPLQWRRPVKDEDVLLFTRDLWSIIHSGVPLVRGIQDVADQVKNNRFRQVLDEIAADVNAGRKLSESLAKYPTIFPEFYTSCVQAGEHAGRLDAILEYLAEILERQVEMKVSVKNAVRYPVIVLCFLALAFLIIVTVVAPRMAGFFAQLHAELPLPTRFLIGLGKFCEANGPGLLALLLVFIFIISFAKKTRWGKPFWDLFKLRLPVFGDLFKKIALSRFTNVLQTLYASGVVLPKALHISARTAQNEILTRAILRSEAAVNEGKALSEAFEENEVFPPLLIRMVSTGEKTGYLEGMLKEVSHHYERSIQYMTKSMTTLIEPILTVMLGLMIFVFALGVFLPMWKVTSLIRH